jgi:hypothetical protein
MQEPPTSNGFRKCPHCNCMFLTDADLEKHMACFSDKKDQHVYRYENAHGRIERGYGEE